jgi:hypothetical protein
MAEAKTTRYGLAEYLISLDERVADVELTADVLKVRLMDGRTISVPLKWHPRLLHATEDQRKNWQIASAGYGIHWEDIDEELCRERLLLGAPAPTTHARNPSIIDQKEITLLRTLIQDPQ